MTRLIIIAFALMQLSALAQQLPPEALSGAKWFDLTKLEPKEAKVGYLKLYVGKLSLNGRPMKVGKREVRSGLYAHAPSRLMYDLTGLGYLYLRGKVALEDGSFGEVQFEILGDGKSLWQSEVIKKDNDRMAKDAAFAVPIAEVSKLELVVSALGTKDSDHSIWLDPELGKK